MKRTDRWLYGWGLGYAAVGAASLLVPLYALELGAGAFLVGLIAATAAFAGVPGAILWGRLAGRTHRRRPFVLVALASSTVVLAALPVATTPWLVLVANAALWFVVSAAAPVLNLIVVEGRPEAEWSTRIAFLNAVQGYGWVAGLLLGAAWTATVPRLVGVRMAQQTLFVVLAVTTFAATLVAGRWYPERPSTTPGQFERVFRRLGREGWGAGRYLRTIPYGPGRLYWAFRSYRDGSGVLGRFGSRLTRYLVAATLFSTGFAVFWGPMPAFLTVEGYATDVVFVLFLVGNLGSAVAYTPSGSLASRFDPLQVQAAALGARAVLFPLVPVVSGTFAVVTVHLLAVGFAAIGVTWAVIAVTATALVTRLASAQVRSDAFGAYTALTGLGAGVGSALGGAVADATGYLIAFAVAGALVLLGCSLGLSARSSTASR